MISGTTFRCADKSGSFMNLGDILNKVAGAVLGGAPAAMLGAGTSSGFNLGNLTSGLSSLFNKWTGKGLTGAEQEANSFSAQQAELAFQRESGFQREMFEKETELANTSYQRQVADMKAAGLNPMLAAGGNGSVVPSAGSASSASPSSVSPGSGNLGDVLSMFMLPAQLKSMTASTALNEATAGKVAAEAKEIEERTRGHRLQNDFFEDSSALRLEALRLENDLSDASASQIWSNIDKQRHEIDKLIAETKSESERASLISSQRILNEVTARKVKFMMPYEANLLAAETDSEKARAGLDYLLAAREKGLLDGGQVQSILREAAAAADSSEAAAAIDKIRASAARGDFRPLQQDFSDMSLGEKVVNSIYSGIHSVRTALSPLK